MRTLMTPNSEKDLDNSDNTNVDQQVKDESDSWVPLKIEEAEKKSTEFEARVMAELY